MSAQAEDSKGSFSDKLAYVDGRGQGGSSDSLWASRSDQIPISPSQPHKPDGPRGVDSLRKKNAVKSMGDLPNMRSPAEGKHRHIDESTFSAPGRDHVPRPASSGRYTVDDRDKLQQKAAGYASTAGRLPWPHASTTLSLGNRLSEDLDPEADDAENSNSERSDVLSECSEEGSSDEEEEDDVVGVCQLLRLHPAHPGALFMDQATEESLASQELVSMPGCSTAEQLAEAAAKDPRLGARVKDFDFAVMQGKVFGAAESMTIGVNLVCSEIAFASSQSQPQHCVIAVVPCSERPKSPAPQKSSDGKTGGFMRRHKEPAELARGWLFTCPTEATMEILELFSQNGAVRRNLSTCFNLLPGAKAGSGTFGSIIRASCAKKPGREVAVKVMKKSVKKSAIQSEISMLVAAQGSPVIVKFLSAFYDECQYSGCKIWALAFEVHPGDLYDRVSGGKRMMEADAMPLAHDLFSAISFLQGRNIFHRDIKPENLLMTTSGGVVLTDFGIATHLSNLQETVSDQRGTIGYASPEMLNGTATGYEGDNFGAGIVMYFMISKSTPFLAPTPERMIEKTNQCDVNMGYGCFEHLSHDCRNLISGLIRFHPHDRLTMVKVLGCRKLFSKFNASTEKALRPLPRNSMVRPNDPTFLLGRGSEDLPLYNCSDGVLPRLRRVPPKLAPKKIVEV